MAGKISMRARGEVISVVAERHRAAGRIEKGRILDELCTAPTSTGRESSLSLYRGGTADTRKSIRMHFHYAFFAEILHELARTVARLPLADTAHRNVLRDAAKALYGALENTDEGMDMTADEEVLLLHVME
jgi:hypothetical protein